MTNEITSTHDMAENEWIDDEDPQGAQTAMFATKTAEGRGIEFHVSMRDYTQRDMEALIVEAAARVLVGNYGDAKLAKLIEERCVALTMEKADKALAAVTTDIIDQPITPKYPFMKPDAAPTTMREFIGLTGREYLTAYVDSYGKPTTDRHYGKTRVQYLVETYMQQAFKNEISKATNATISEIQKEIRAKHDAFLNAEKTRVREALAKVVA